MGLVEFQGSKKNNIILAGLPECHNFAPFLDTRPGVPASERYKAVGGTLPKGLVAYASSDAVHWRKMQAESVITQGAFDSHNVAFYSQAEKKYVCYLRNRHRGHRWVFRCTSADFLNWTDPVPMESGDTLVEGFTQIRRLPISELRTSTSVCPAGASSEKMLCHKRRKEGLV